MEFWANRGSDYPFFVSLEDATRAKGRNPDHDADRGHPIADVISRYFAQSGEGTNERFSTPRLSYRTLAREPYHFAVLESYHRVAADPGSTGSQTTDLVYTSNPRQPWMSDTISNRREQFQSQKGSTGPQYQTRIKGLSGLFSNFLGGIDGRNTFYGRRLSPSRHLHEVVEARHRTTSRHTCTSQVTVDFTSFGMPRRPRAEPARVRSALPPRRVEIHRWLSDG